VESKPKQQSCALILAASSLTSSLVTRPQIELSIKIFIVLLILTFIYSLYRVADLIGWV
jgi:hypothetical protein